MELATGSLHEVTASLVGWSGDRGRYRARSNIISDLWAGIAKPAGFTRLFFGFRERIAPSRVSDTGGRWGYVH